MSEEKTITIRIPKDLHRNIKIRAAQKGMSLKDYILDLVQKDFEKFNSKEM